MMWNYLRFCSSLARIFLMTRRVNPNLGTEKGEDDQETPSSCHDMHRIEGYPASYGLGIDPVQHE